MVLVTIAMMAPVVAASGPSRAFQSSRSLGSPRSSRMSPTFLSAIISSMRRPPTQLHHLVVLHAHDRCNGKFAALSLWPVNVKCDKQPRGENATPCHSGCLLLGILASKTVSNECIYRCTCEARSLKAKEGRCKLKKRGYVKGSATKSEKSANFN